MKQMQLHDQEPLKGFDRSNSDSRRVPLERKVILKFHHFGGFFIEYSGNVSLTGMFIKTDTPKPPGSVFIFEIWLGEDHRLVHGLGEVVWMRSVDEGASRPAGMGIRYLKIDDKSRAVIKRVITEHVEKGGEVFNLAATGPDDNADDQVGAGLRPELSLVEAVDARPVSRSDLLVIDEDLLGFDNSPDEMPTEPVPKPADRPASGRGLKVALLLVILGAVLGGAAYLFSTDLLPF